MLGGRREKLSENKIRAIRMLHENSTMKRSAKLAKRGMNPKALNAAVEAGWYDNYIRYCLGIIEMVEKETGVKLRREW